MTSQLCTKEETINCRTTSTEKSYKHCVEAHLEQSHTLKWHTDSHMATAVALGAVPTLTSVAGLPALAGAVASQKSTPSLLTKRSSVQTKYLNSMTGYTLHIWPNGSVSGVRSYNNASRQYAMLEFVTTLVTFGSIWKTSGDDQGEDPKVEIRGVESRMWLCMNKSGALYGSKKKRPECEFHEEYDGSNDWNTYYSVQHPNNSDKSVKWYIALNRHGRPRVAMTSKHKSSRFKTAATQPTTEPPLLPEEMARKIRRNKPKKTYNRAPSGGKPISVRRKQVPESEEKPAPRESKLSKMLSTIENAIAQAPKSKNSDPMSFHDSMYIDLGDNNPFLNIGTGGKIRHPKKKRIPRRRKPKSYRRKD